ncbi:LETM1 and EF-hand domain-containing protein 1, mitochondrial [Hordeum vulgare]|nr:LETM1 and EF-hand domain-containing protein 1, mitochondrial [Hordeum vulgare]
MSTAQDATPLRGRGAGTTTAANTFFLWVSSSMVVGGAEMSLLRLGHGVKVGGTPLMAPLESGSSELFFNRSEIDGPFDIYECRSLADTKNAKEYRCAHVPEEVRDCWNRLFQEGYQADVRVSTDDGIEILSHSCILDEMKKYGLHLLVLSHVFSIQSLKIVCTDQL